MKVSRNKKLLIVTILLGCYINCFAQNDVPCYYYDNYGVKDMMTKQTIFVIDKSERYLTPHIRYFFTYDEYKRVIKKVAYRWNDDKLKWECKFKLDFIYDNNSLIVQYARWDSDNEMYDNYTEKAIYTISFNKNITYEYYKKCHLVNEWNLVTNISEIFSDIKWIESHILLAKFP